MLLFRRYCRLSSRIINPRWWQKLKLLFLSSLFLNRLWINVKQMFGNMLIISCVSGTNRLSPFLSLLPPRQSRNQFTFRRVRLFYVNRQPLWQRVWLGGGPQIPLKVHSSLVCVCLKTGRVTREEGCDRQSVVVSVPISVCALTVKPRYPTAAMYLPNASECIINQIWMAYFPSYMSPFEVQL